MNIILLSVLVLASIWLVLRARFLLKNRYIGFGWALEWKEGKVIVVSRLLNSPAGRANVPVRSILVKYGLTPLEFLTGDEWSAFMDRLPESKVGDTVRFHLETLGGEIRKIELTAEVIQGPIPIPSFTPDYAKKFDIVYGVRRNRRTGLLHETRRPNKAWQSLRGY